MEDQMHDSVKSLLKDVTMPTQEQQVQQQPVILDNDEPEDLSNKNAGEVQQKENSSMTKEALSAGADVTIGLFDLAQAQGFKAAGKAKYKRKLKRLYGDDALDKIEHLKNEQEALKKNTVSQTFKEFTPGEYGMLRLEKSANEFLEDIPLSDVEKENIKIPLMELMKQNGGAIPPSYLLMFALAGVVGSRTAQLLML